MAANPPAATSVQGLCGVPDGASKEHQLLRSSQDNTTTQQNIDISPKSTKSRLSGCQSSAKRSKSASIGEEDDEFDEQENYYGEGCSSGGQGTSTVREDGFGVVSVTPCVSELVKCSLQGPTQMTFSYAWAGLSQEGHNEVKWSALLFKGHLYLSVPNGLVVERSKEAFVTLLEFAEEQLDCSAIVVYFAKNRPERREYILLFYRSIFQE